jgi:hypothetical protein
MENLETGSIERHEAAGSTSGMKHRLKATGLRTFITPRELVYIYFFCWLAASALTMLWVFFTAWSSPGTDYRVIVSVNDQGEMLAEQVAFLIFILSGIYVLIDQVRTRRRYLRSPACR